MMVTRARDLVLATLLGLAVALGAGGAVALAEPVGGQPFVAAAPFVAADPALTQDTTPEPGPTLDPAESEQANAEKTKNKLIVGGIAAVLLVIVLWGRSVRKKRTKNSK